MQNKGIALYSIKIKHYLRNLSIADAAATYQCESQTKIEECKTRTDGKTFCCGLLGDRCCTEEKYNEQAETAGKLESGIKKVAG